MLESYQAFGDCETMLELTEGMIRAAANDIGDASSIAFGEHTIDYAVPFDRVTYGELFEKGLGCSMHDEDAVRAKAEELGFGDAATKNHWLLVSEFIRCSRRGNTRRKQTNICNRFSKCNFTADSSTRR